MRGLAKGVFRHAFAPDVLSNWSDLNESLCHSAVADVLWGISLDGIAEAEAVRAVNRELEKVR